MTPRTIQDTLVQLKRAGYPYGRQTALPSPAYRPLSDPAFQDRLLFGVASLQQHMTSEGWQLQLGLREAGYKLCGHGLDIAQTSCASLLAYNRPSTAVVQDKREWDGQTQSSRHDREARFRDLYVLPCADYVFKATVLKDAHQRPDYHAHSAQEIGAHAWIVYYHPDIVRFLAPYTRREHLIRTWHSVDAEQVPPFSTEREGVVLSGAISGAYPLRQRLIACAGQLPKTTVLPHPGYHAKGSATPAYLHSLSHYKAAICTSSIFGYALRKLIEATACGCRVLTDLPSDDVLPEIEENLVRIHPDTPTARLADLLRDMLADYDPERQDHLARKARAFYDYRALGRRLAQDIETLRLNYNTHGIHPPS